MDSSLTITNIHRVLKGAFHPGLLPRKTTERGFDAFVYYTTGTASYIFDTYSFTVTPNTLFYLSRSSIYEIQVFEPATYIFVDFDFSEQDPPQKSTLFRETPVSLKNDFSRLFYLWNERNPWKKAEEFGILYSVYAQALKSSYKNYYKSSHVLSGIAAYISDHYTDPELSVPAIAQAVGISETHLRRILKNQLNISPVSYINFIRLENAKQMLQNSNYSIEEIAASVGIPDAFYFSRLFKKEIGLSPSAYRKQEKDTLSDV